MPSRLPCFLALLCLAIAPAPGQQATPGIVQPGAPGQRSRTLPPSTTTLPLREPSDADVSFMQGMIMHHGQAVAMTAMIRNRSQDKDVREIGRRISVSQTDELKYMKQWLEDRGKPIEMPMAPMDHSHMDHSEMETMDMGSMPGVPMMPGMLTPQQMDALAAATGPAFDHLFLTGMIQHHTGALTMVQQLFNTAGAGQDPQLFDFATDVDNTQHAEIRIMQAMLQTLPPAKSPAQSSAQFKEKQ